MAPYAPLDDKFDEAPSNAGLTLAAVGAYACSITYCTRHLTDGRFPRAALRLWGKTGVPPAVLTELVERGKWIELEDGSFNVTSFRRWNPSAAKVRRKKAQTAKRQERRRDRLREEMEARAARDASVTRDARVTHDATTSPSPPPSTASRGSFSGAAEVPRLEVAVEPAKKRPGGPPKGEPTSPAVVTWACEWGIDPAHQRFPQFLHHHRARRASLAIVDWGEAWASWLCGAPQAAPLSTARPKALDPVHGQPLSAPLPEPEDLFPAVGERQ